MMKFGIVMALTTACFLGGCGKKSTDDTTDSSSTSASEIAENSLSGAANSSEPNGTQASYKASPARSIWQALSPIQLAYASTACPTIAGVHAATCSAGVFDLVYNDCSFGQSAVVWNGSQTVSFDGGTCPTMNLAGLSGRTLTRLFGAGTTEKNAAGVTTTIDTTNAASSGWDSGVTVTGEGETAQFSGATDGTRMLTIRGIHLTAVGPAGRTLFDHTVSTPNAITVSGAGASRTVASGTITVQHNLAKFTASAAITTALSWSMAGCCHPASGVITSTLSGSKTGTETLTFTGGTSGTCGTATLVDNTGASSDITLSHCF